MIKIIERKRQKFYYLGTLAIKKSRTLADGLTCRPHCCNKVTHTLIAYIHLKEPYYIDVKTRRIT